MVIEDIKNWIAVQKQEIPVTAKVEIAKVEGFFEGALKTVAVLEENIRATEAKEEQIRLEKEKAKAKEEKKETK